MSVFNVLVPLEEISIKNDDLLSVKRLDLVPILQNHHLLNQYAEHIVQSQSVLLNGIDPKLIQNLHLTIQKIIDQLNRSKKIYKQRKFNRLQQWLGLELEFKSNKIYQTQELEQLILDADQFTRLIQIESQKSQARIQQAKGLREQMAVYIRAAQEFIKEYPKFSPNVHPLDNFIERLSKKVQTLETIQASNDIVLTQMQLTQQLSLTLIDRFKEAQMVLIPAWQFHLAQTNQNTSLMNLDELELSREKLIKSLKKSLLSKSGDI